MTKLSKILLLLCVLFLFSWLLPWGYHFATDKPQRSPFTLYSCVKRCFAWIEFKEGQLLRTDQRGNLYTDHQFDSILPLFYYRQLLSEERLPDSLMGKSLTPSLISHASFWFRHTPKDINKVKPTLYPLLESQSGRVDLKMSEDVSRINHRIEFIDMESNSINEEKSERFTRTLQAKGFHFPSRRVWGNPTIKKEYDEGYFILDDKGALFHIKQIASRPFARRVELPDEIRIKELFITEFSSRKTRAFFTTEDDSFYLLTAPDYSLLRLPIAPFDATREEMTIHGDLLHWTIELEEEHSTKYYAFDADNYQLVDSMSITHPHSSASWEEYIFPFELTFTSYRDQFFYPRLKGYHLSALPINLLLSLLFLLLAKRKKRGWGKSTLLVLPLLLLTGIYSWIPLVWKK